MQKEGQSSRQFVKSHLMTIMGVDIVKPQLFTPNLKTIQNPCLSLDPGWFLFSPNGCFLLDKTGTAESKTDLMRRKKVAHEVRGFVSYI
ncbi:IS1380-Spn1 transposase [Streptococcus pneumoniae]|nr:IS1380-Spn1 transposase [Streptococcus pneumoniae]